MVVYYIMKKILCLYCLQAFSTEEALKRHVTDCFKNKPKIIMPKNGIR